MTTQPFEGRPVQIWELEFNFGDRIRKARRVLGLTVEQLAIDLGVKKQVVSQWETGVSNPRAPHAIARRIEYVYGVPAWWLLGNDEPPTGGTDEGQAARPEGLEPPTFWSGVSEPSNVIPVDFGQRDQLELDEPAQVLSFPGGAL